MLPVKVQRKLTSGNTTDIFIVERRSSLGGRRAHSVVRHAFLLSPGEF